MIGKTRKVFALVLLVTLICVTMVAYAAEREIQNYDFDLTTTSESNQRLGGPAFKVRTQSVPAVVRCDYFNGQHTVKYTIWTGDEYDAICLTNEAWLMTGRRNMYYQGTISNINLIPHYLAGRKNTNETPGMYIRAYGTWSPDDN